MIKSFPTLYHKDARGKERQWSIYVQTGPDGYPEMVSESGCVGGKLTKTELKSFL